MVVFKIVGAEEWRAAEAAGVFAGAAVDRADGFIHFSTAEQAAGDGGQMVRRPRRSDAGGDRRRALGRGPALGAVARRRAVSASLRAPADERRCVWSRPLPLGADGRHVFGSLDA